MRPDGPVRPGRRTRSVRAPRQARDDRPPDHDRGRESAARRSASPTRSSRSRRARTGSSSSASSAAACRSPIASRRRSLEHEGVDVPVGRARHHVLPRRPVAGRPAAHRQGHGPPVRPRRRDGRPRRRRAVHRPDDPRGDGRAASTSGGRRRSGWRSWSTAATASCRSAPTTSARTCRPRARRSSSVRSRRSTARTGSRSSARCRAGGRAGRVTP